VNGGNENAKYFVSLGYFDQGGIIDKYSFKRYNLRSNLDIKLAHGLNLGLDIGARQEIRNQGYYSVSNQAWNNPPHAGTAHDAYHSHGVRGTSGSGEYQHVAKFNPNGLQ